MVQAQILKVVVASPSDVQAERKCLERVVAELNRGIVADRGLRIELGRWETDAFPGFHPEGPQGLIDHRLRIDDCDVLIGIFWKRFGTPVHDAKSGTEHEFRIAYETWKRNRRPQIMVYFNEKRPSTPPSIAELDQWRQVLEFRQAFPAEGLWWPYRGAKQFEELVRQHLTNFVRDRYPLPPLAQPPLAEKDLDKAWVGGYTRVAPNPNLYLDQAPPRLNEWVGRNELLNAVSIDWAEAEKRVTALIGFGGEGKSSLVRYWQDQLLADPAAPQPRGVFWWSFYENSTKPEAFFEQALTYLSGEKALLDQYEAASAQVYLISAMLTKDTKDRYLFVLDGLEVMQHHEGDQYGLLINPDLADFLTYFAEPKHRSFCLITSRVPLSDLKNYVTVVQRDVDHLTAQEGRTLLRYLGVTGGSDVDLEHEVEAWDGHALTLSLLGSYLAKNHGGNFAHIYDIGPVEELSAPPGDRRAQHVHRVLRHYDKYLSPEEQLFLLIFCAFRLPVSDDAFDKVFRTAPDTSSFNTIITVLDDAAFTELLEQLRSYRILRYDAQLRQYTTHPLIRDHYANRLNEDTRMLRAVHARIKDYYQKSVPEVLEILTLSNLNPLIEAIHHACRAGLYDEGFQIYQSRITGVIDKLGASESLLALMKEFFHDGDTTGEPLVGDGNTRWAKYEVWHETGLCFMHLGRLSEAERCFENASKEYEEVEEYGQVNSFYRSLAELRIHLGKFAASIDVANKARDLILKLMEEHESNEDLLHADKREMFVTQTLLAFADDLYGDVEYAGLEFTYAEDIHKEIEKMEYLVATHGIRHADHLRRTGNLDGARRITEANLSYCRDNGLIVDQSRCYRLLGDLDAAVKQHEHARQLYEQAIEIARRTSRRDVLIEALFAHGRSAAQRGEVDIARNDLNLALGYATKGEYNIYEADTRVGLAWMHLAMGDLETARLEAQRAQELSKKMSYHWGLVDAAEVWEAVKR
jgi:tetratricopeptide (TPR) repeat protein